MEVVAELKEGVYCDEDEKKKKLMGTEVHVQFRIYSFIWALITHFRCLLMLFFGINNLRRYNKHIIVANSVDNRLYL